MLLKNRLTTLLIAIFAIALPGRATTTMRQSLVDGLSILDNPKDSIRQLYNIFDLSEKAQRPAVARQIYEVAKRNGNRTVMLDALRNWGNSNQRDTLLIDSLIRLTAEMPASDDQRETELFLKLTRVSSSARYGSDTDKKSHLQEALQHAKSEQFDNIYDQIEALATVCMLVGNSSRGKIFEEYFDKSQQLIDRLPKTSGAVRNMFYNQSAIIHDNTGNHAAAVSDSRRMLALMDTLEANYHAQGRMYRNYDTMRYTALRRMLANPEALTREQLDSVSEQIQLLAERNPEVRRDIANTNLPEAFYNYATGDYVKALPMLVNAYEKRNDKYMKRRLLRMIRHATAETGNTGVSDRFNELYVKALEEFIDTDYTDMMSELDVTYRVNELSLNNRELQAEQDRVKARNAHTIMMVCGIAALIFLLLSAVMFRLVRKFRRQARSLAVSNDQLNAERQNLIETRQELVDARDIASRNAHDKSQFLANLAHELRTPLDSMLEYSQLLVDCTDGDNRKYVQRYADVISLNGEMIKNLIKDFDTAEDYAVELTVNPMPVSVDEVCRLAIDTVRPKLNSHTKLIYRNTPEDNVTIVSDGNRIEQVLVNVLDNAAKFTSEGTITLEYEVNSDASSINFIVTDTGIGIPKGKERAIFERFEKSGRQQGIGLAICADIAKKLGGDIYADPKVTRGARFVFTLPIQ